MIKLQPSFSIHFFNVSPHTCANPYMLIARIIAAANMVEKERSRRLGTSILNQVVQEAALFKPPPRTRGGKRGRIYYTTQVQ